MSQRFTWRDTAKRRPGALFYLMFTLVDPHADTYRVFQDMMYAVCQRFTAKRGVVGMDFNDHNARGAVGRIVGLLPRLFGATVDVVDVHSYYAWDSYGGDSPVP